MEVIILAGGLGTRLRGVVQDRPKCLAPVDGRPFLSYLLSLLSDIPVSRVLLSVGYLAAQVRSFVEQQAWPFPVDLVEEAHPLGTGGALRLALSCCRDDEVLVLNGDTCFLADLSTLRFDAPVTLFLKPLHDAGRYGTVSLRDGKVVAFSEKAPCRDGLINGGVYALNRSLLSMDDLPEVFSFERDLLPRLAGRGAVAGKVSDAYFLDIGVPDDYARAQWELPAALSIRKASDAACRSGADSLVLDRDGVVNRLLPGDYVKHWSEFTFLPGVLDAWARWATRFRYILLMTNQRGVGKGLMTRAQLDEIHARMVEAVQAAGGRIDRIYVCTAVAEDDPFRKPQTGMYRSARQDFPDLGTCVMLGDSDTDQAFAAACGMRFIRV